MKGGKPDADLIDRAKEVKEQLAELEPQLAEIETELADGLKKVPNIIFNDVPLGGEECSVEVASWGEHRTDGVDHLDYALSGTGLTLSVEPKSLASSSII